MENEGGGKGGKAGALRQVTVPCLHEWELVHMAKKQGRRSSEGEGSPLGQLLGWLRPLYF